MKLRYLLAMVAFIPFLSEAQANNTCSEGEQERANSWTIRFIRDSNPETTPNIESFCAEFRKNELWAARCHVSCESQYREYFKQVMDDKREAEAKKVATQQEEQRKAAAKQQAKAAREAALKSGQAKPANLGEAAIVYNAEHGGSLASAPKVRPDDGMYYMHGKIKFAGKEPEFFATLSPSQENELLANVLRRSRGMGESTDYFAVVIPKNLEKYYFNNAKVEGGFDLVGRYVLNTTYETVSGQKKSAPVFEAVYFVVWK